MFLASTRRALFEDAAARPDERRVDDRLVEPVVLVEGAARVRVVPEEEDVAEKAHKGGARSCRCESRIIFGRQCSRARRSRDFEKSCGAAYSIVIHARLICGKTPEKV